MPNALAGAAGAAARAAAAGAGGALAAAVGAFAAAAIRDDVGGGKLWFRRRFLPSRPTWNVVAETRRPRARERTLVFVAHHDAAHWACCSTPACCRSSTGAPGLLARSNTSPPLMAPVIAGPLLVALGALAAAGVAARARLGRDVRRDRRRDAVPGANDNLTASRR